MNGCATTTRVKRSTTDTPQNLEQTDRFVGLLGNEQARLDALELEAEAEIRQIRENLRKESEPVRKRRNNLMTGIFTFASANKATLIFVEGKKTVELTNGTITWRWTPPAVSVENDEEMIANLKRRGLDEYVRVKEELDRQKLLADRKDLPRVAGLAFTQKEEFVVKPHASTEVAKTRTITVD